MVNFDNNCDVDIVLWWPVETIDWLSPSLSWHIIYTVATSSNSQPCDDVLHKDSVQHSSRVLSCLSNTKPLRKQTENQKIEDRRQKTKAKPCHALSSSQMTPSYAVGGVNHMPIPKCGSSLCCQLQLSWHPGNHSSKGDTQFWCIMIGIVLKNCIEGTAPTSWSIVGFHTQPLSPNHRLCCRCRNWRRFYLVTLTSAWQTKQKIVISLVNRSAHHVLDGAGCSGSRIWLCVWEDVTVLVSKLEMLHHRDVDFCSINEVEVLIVGSHFKHNGS